tara:strand:+ start:2283 stop:2627 length:345 start_codon:yes stop_codon:yes gene_type:complete
VDKCSFQRQGHVNSEYASTVEEEENTTATRGEDRRRQRAVYQIRVKTLFGNAPPPHRICFATAPVVDVYAFASDHHHDAPIGRQFYCADFVWIHFEPVNVGQLQRVGVEEVQEY